MQLLKKLINRISICCLVFLPFFNGCIQSESAESKQVINFNSAEKEASLLLPGIISTQLYERDFAISPDRNEVIYTLGNYDQSQRILVSMRKENQEWEDKKILPFSGTYQDIEPFFSPDGKYLFFASNRPIFQDSLRTDYNIWFCTKEKGQWVNPTALDSSINKPGDEFYPAVTDSGNLYFTASHPGGFGLEDIFVSEKLDGAYQAPIPLDSTINSKTYEFNAYVSPAEDLIIYSSYGRPDGKGGGDLYYSQKNEQGQWLPAKHLGDPFNSQKLDFSPYYDAQHEILYFSSLRTTQNTPIKSINSFIENTNHPLNGLSNIYSISAKGIFSK